MATKRMFSRNVVESDSFLDMPLSTQCLYFHLGMEADDDGFVGSPRKVQRTVGASNDDLTLLAAKGFIITFATGVLVITHFKQNNRLQSDRCQETIYTNEKTQLFTQQNKAYALITAHGGATSVRVIDLDEGCVQNGHNLDTGCVQNVSILCPQNRLDKISIGEGTVAVTAPATAPTPSKKRFAPPTVDDVKAYCAARGNNIDPEHFVDYYTANGWTQGKGKPVKDWRACVRTWEHNGISAATATESEASKFENVL